MSRPTCLLVCNYFVKRPLFVQHLRSLYRRSPRRSFYNESLQRTSLIHDPFLEREGKVASQTFWVRPQGPKNAAEESFRLSTLDLFNTQNYSTHAFFFKIPDNEKPAVAEVLKHGLGNALGQCRHMAGTIRENEYGDFSIIKTSNSSVKVVAQWLDRPGDDFPSYAELEKANFTAGSLGDPARLTIKGMTMGSKLYPDENPAMCAFQLNFIPGGMIFTVHKHHAALDIAGTASLVHQIGANCCSIINGTSTPGWDESLMDRSRFFSKTAANNMIDPPPAPSRHPDWLPCSWLLFHLPPSKAAELKKLASPSDGSWISTHDALAAFLWRVMSKLRSKIYLVDPTTPALFFEAINMRERLTPKLSARYQGNCLGAAASTNHEDAPNLAEVISEAPLSRLATFVRKLTSSVTEQTLENTLTMLAPIRNRWKAHPSLDALPPLSFVLTDWRSSKMCDVDFGFGRPAAFRQLSDVVLENMVTIYPPLKSGDGTQGLEVMVPFEKHALEMLIQDSDMKRFFDFRGIEACPP